VTDPIKTAGAATATVELQAGDTLRVVVNVLA